MISSSTSPNTRTRCHRVDEGLCRPFNFCLPGAASIDCRPGILSIFTSSCASYRGCEVIIDVPDLELNSMASFLTLLCMYIRTLVITDYIDRKACNTYQLHSSTASFIATVSGVGIVGRNSGWCAADREPDSCFPSSLAIYPSSSAVS